MAIIQVNKDSQSIGIAGDVSYQIEYHYPSERDNILEEIKGQLAIIDEACDMIDIIFEYDLTIL